MATSVGSMPAIATVKPPSAGKHTPRVPGTWAPEQQYTAPCAAYTPRARDVDFPPGLAYNCCDHP